MKEKEYLFGSKEFDDYYNEQCIYNGYMNRMIDIYLDHPYGKDLKVTKELIDFVAIYTTRCFITGMDINMYFVVIPDKVTLDLLIFALSKSDRVCSILYHIQLLLCCKEVTHPRDFIHTDYCSVLRNFVYGTITNKSIYDTVTDTKIYQLIEKGIK